ncbi:FIST signal transduction protein [Anaerocolumna jejuensis]|uniref:FIST signal transduction protein n=1 Tax=Anaerocolumna jejuensis TaxID=259063 RepID=UPI003F7C771D
MEYRIGRSRKNQGKEAVKEAVEGLENPNLILFFSDTDNFTEYTIEMKRLFPESIIIGSTTFVGLCREGAYKDTLLVLGIEEGIECYGDVLEEVDKYPLKYIDRVMNCVNRFKNTENTVCFEVSSALISSEELILSTFNSVLMDKGIPLFGGSAGDRGNAEKTMISFNGKVMEKACAFVVLKNLGGGIRLYRENIYKPTKHYFTATKVDIRNRTVYEYDYEPAAQVMAKALNTDIKNLPQYLDSYPLGRLIGSDMYITANQGITDHGGMAYHARVYNNSHMVLLEPDDYKEVLRRTREQVKKDVPNPSLTIMIHCLARSILFEKDGYLNDFAKEMGGTLGNYVGFAGYGEQLNQQHFNQTMVLAVFE